jgi:hypothetical protein
MNLISDIEKDIFMKMINQHGATTIWKVHDYYPEIESAKLVKIQFRGNEFRDRISDAIDVTPITQKIMKKDGVFYIESITEHHRLFMCDESEVKQHMKNLNEAAIANRLSAIRNITEQIADIVKINVDTDFKEFMKKSL